MATFGLANLAMLYSFATPSLAERREERSARAAFTAYAIVRLRNSRPLTPNERISCICCGQPGPGDWCNTCEVAGNHPVPSQPHIITPLCNSCVADNMKCPICGTKPADGPADEDFAPVGGVDALQIAGWM